MESERRVKLESLVASSLGIVAGTALTVAGCYDSNLIPYTVHSFVGAIVGGATFYSFGGSVNEIGRNTDGVFPGLFGAVVGGAVVGSFSEGLMIHNRLGEYVVGAGTITGGAVGSVVGIICAAASGVDEKCSSKLSLILKEPEAFSSKMFMSTVCSSAIVLGSNYLFEYLTR